MDVVVTMQVRFVETTETVVSQSVTVESVPPAELHDTTVRLLDLARGHIGRAASAVIRS